MRATLITWVSGNKTAEALTGSFANPSSEHWVELPARQAVEKARAQVAA